ncbi:MAG: glycosyltransferase family 39 protein [Planctomycetia bacterium]|nr:glycosyltransferase family 39 protein [Planctomycetia bacterium]
MTLRHPLAIVLIASTACLALGFAATPFWDEDEPRFAAIAQTMLDTGNWIVPMYNDTLAVDKPVLMHWAMATAFGCFGTSEFAARLPAAIATLLTALALLRAGTRWFDPTTGVIASLAYVGCLLVGIEAHAATPDAILTALTAWSTILAAEVLLPNRAANQTASNRATNPQSQISSNAAASPRLTVARAALIGGLMGLAVLCKGPVGYVGPLAVVMPWAWWMSLKGRNVLLAAVPAVFDAMRTMRLGTMTVAMLAVAAPWYSAVAIRTAGEWPIGFFLIHNVGRFAAPMEKHSGGWLFHPLAMLAGFFPWSCFLPLAIVLAGWRIWKRVDAPALTHTLALVLFWIVVWVGAFSAAATKLPNYVQPAYPAAALLVGALGVEASRRMQWAHPRWMVAGLGWLAVGGLATSVTVIVATFYGLSGAEPAALVGLVPVLGAVACFWSARRNCFDPLVAMTATGLLFTGLAVGPAAWQMSKANALPTLVQQAHRHAGGHARLGTFTQNTPNIVFYSHGHVHEWQKEGKADALQFLASGNDAVLIVPEHCFDAIAAALPERVGIVGRGRPLFHTYDFLLLGTKPAATIHNADAGSLTR